MELDLIHDVKAIANEYKYPLLPYVLNTCNNKEPKSRLRRTGIWIPITLYMVSALGATSLRSFA